MNNCNTPTCQINGKIDPLNPDGSPLVVPDGANGKSYGCTGRGRGGNRSGRRTGHVVGAPTLPGVGVAPALPGQPALPSMPAAPTTTLALPVAPFSMPTANNALPVRPMGNGYPAQPSFVEGVPIGAIPTVPGLLGKSSTTLTGRPAQPSFGTPPPPAPFPMPKQEVPSFLLNPAVRANQPAMPVQDKPAMAPVRAPAMVGGLDLLEPPVPATTLKLPVTPAMPSMPAPPPAPQAPSVTGPDSAPSLFLDPKEKLALAPRPAGALPPSADECYRNFFALPLYDQARVFEDGRLGSYEFAQAVASDLRRGITASGKIGADWVFKSFPRTSVEVADFCAMVAAAAPRSSAAPAGAVFDASRFQAVKPTPYISTKAVSPSQWSTGADVAEACLNRLRLVDPRVFGVALRATRVTVHQDDGRTRTDNLADNQLGIYTVMALARADIPYAEAVQVRDQYIAALRTWLFRAGSEPSPSFDRGRAIRDGIATLCENALALEGGIKPAGDPPPARVDMDFSRDPLALSGQADPWAGLQGAGLGPAYDTATGVRFDPATGQPVPGTGNSDTAAQVMGGVGQVAQHGFGVLNTYLASEARRDAASIAAAATTAAAQAAAMSATEVARINADRDRDIARLAAEARAAAATGGNEVALAQYANQIAVLQAQVSASQQASQQPAANTTNNTNTPMSTGAMVGIGAAVVAGVAGVAYIVTRRGPKHNSRRHVARRRNAKAA